MVRTRYPHLCRLAQFIIGPSTLVFRLLVTLPCHGAFCVQQYPSPHTHDIPPLSLFLEGAFRSRTWFVALPDFGRHYEKGRVHVGFSHVEWQIIFGETSWYY
jgi:hypothetical protein